MQRFPAGQWRGRRLLARIWGRGQGLGERGFHAYLMAQDALEVGCQVYWPRCGGTFDWQPIEAVLDVPEAEDGVLMIAFVVGPRRLRRNVQVCGSALMRRAEFAQRWMT
jgi:hypothetical protein